MEQRVPDGLRDMVEHQVGSGQQRTLGAGQVECKVGSLRSRWSAQMH